MFNVLFDLLSLSHSLSLSLFLSHPPPQKINTKWDENTSTITETQLPHLDESKVNKRGIMD